MKPVSERMASDVEMSEHDRPNPDVLMYRAGLVYVSFPLIYIGTSNRQIGTLEK